MAKHKKPEHYQTQIWEGMKRRCNNPNDAAFPYYGGRGITVCDRWLHSLDAFMEDMGPRPSTRHSIDRIDNDGPYSPENCRWADYASQARNRRNNQLITHNGVTKTIAEWARDVGVSRQALRQRKELGWSNEEIVTRTKTRLKRYSLRGVKSRMAAWSPGFLAAVKRIILNDL